MRVVIPPFLFFFVLALYYIITKASPRVSQWAKAGRGGTSRSPHPPLKETNPTYANRNYKKLKN